MGNAPGKEVLMGKMTRNHGSLGYVASKPYWY
jgi:ribosomal protein L35AE/L33A